jgi:aryl-alcohol dehydrogenase-like predicted oxidoreductase
VVSITGRHELTKTVPHRTLGTRGPSVSAIGFGAAVLSPGYFEPVEDDASIDTLRYALDAGICFIDTSDVYGLGHNEQLVGQAIAGRRDEVVLASKFGWVIDGSSGGLVKTNYDLPGFRSNGRPEYVLQQIETSLKRLGVDHLDIYYQHFPDPSTPVEETVGAMAQLVQQGKVRHLGLCNVDAETLRRAHAVHPISVVENEYSLWSRTQEQVLLPATRELGVGFVPWGPLGCGFLAGGVDFVGPGDFRTCQPRFHEANLQRNAERFAPLKALAREYGISPAQLALAWLLHQGDQIVPIPGMTARWQIDENLAAAEVALDAQVLARIEELAPPGLALGPELV